MVFCTSATCACAAVFNYCYAKHHNPTPPPPQHSDLYLYSYTEQINPVGWPTFNIHHCSKNGGGNVENNAQEMVSHLVVLYRSPCSTSLSPPSHHCPLLPITVPSSPSLSPPSHHCLPPSYSTVPSSTPLSPLSHHCPLLPTTVPSSPSHHVIMAYCSSSTTLKVFPPPPNLVS